MRPLRHRFIRSLLAPLIAAALIGPAAALADEGDPQHLTIEAEISTADAASHCAPSLVPAATTCTVDDFGAVGVVAGHKLSYARYDYKPPVGDPLHELGYPRVVIFEAASAMTLKPILISGNDGAFLYDKPEIVKSAGRVLLHIPAAEDGTGNFNRELVYSWTAGAWHDLDVTGWLDDLARRLPKGLAAEKGIFPDYAKMTAGTPLWHEASDGDVCATAGYASLGLAWSGDKLVLKRVRISRAKKYLDDQGCFEGP